MVHIGTWAKCGMLLMLIGLTTPASNKITKRTFDSSIFGNFFFGKKMVVILSVRPISYEYMHDLGRGWRCV